MPKVAIVQGVKVQFYPREHRPPHFHAVIAEHKAVVDIGTMRIIGGSLPVGKRKALLEWAMTNKAALYEAWAAVESKRKPRKIR